MGKIAIRFTILHESAKKQEKIYNARLDVEREKNSKLATMIETIENETQRLKAEKKWTEHQWSLGKL